MRITWTMHMSVLEPAAHGTDVANDVVPSALRVIIFSTKVWVAPKKHPQEKRGAVRGEAEPHIVVKLVGA